MTIVDYTQFGLILVTLLIVLSNKNIKNVHVRISNKDIVKQLVKMQKLMSLISYKPKRIVFPEEPEKEIRKAYILKYTYNQKPQQCKVTQFSGDILDIDAFNHMKSQLKNIHVTIEVNDFRKL